jgi:hypothetical protein
MSRYLMFGLGILARVVSVLADCYSDWIWRQLAEGVEATFDVIADFWEFSCWVSEELIGRWCGYNRSYELNY